MKFHAEIENITKMKELAMMVSTLRYMDEKMYIKLTPDNFLLFVPESSKTDSIFSFNITSKFFEKYVLVGLDQSNDTDNKIYIEASSVNMHAAFSSLSKGHVRHVKINLVNTNNKFPCISVTLKLISIETAEFVEVCNEVPILIIPKLHWENYELPVITGFTISSNLPRFKTLRKYVDTQKSVSKRIHLIFKSDDNFMISARTDNVSVCTTFKNITCINCSDNTNPENVDVLTILDAKKFSNLLHYIQFSSQKMKCETKNSGPLRIFFNVGDFIKASCLLSVLCAEDDDE